MILTTAKLGKSFGGLAAVQDVDMTIEQGKITAIIGPNGAGKTTLFNLLSGFYKPSSGRIEFLGEDITHLPVHEVARRGIARTFQATHLFQQQTCLDNLIVGHRLRAHVNVWDALFRTPRHRREMRKCVERAFAAMEFAGISQLAYKPVGAISQEQQKRLSIALALVTEPKLLLLDEIAGGVNPEETEGLSELIGNIVKSGITVCFIEHKMQMVMNLADHIVVLNHGCKIAEGPPAEVSRNKAVIEAYLGGETNAHAT